jgi:signal transduction histidine kinase
VREEERTRIARELHDELGQALTALRIDLGWLRGKCGGLGESAAERVTAAFGVVEQSIVSLRRISEDLRPAMLDSLGLAAAVEHHVTQFSQRTGIPCELHRNREEFELDSNIATAVFRFVQEALTNVARHAEASEVSVTIEEGDGCIQVAVADDGQGMIETGGKKTFGLLGMKERITILGGHLDIDSQPGHGTRVACRLPLPKETPA